MLNKGKFHMGVLIKSANATSYVTKEEIVLHTKQGGGWSVTETVMMMPSDQSVQLKPVQRVFNLLWNRLVV